MARSARRLGRGLDSLVSNLVQEHPSIDRPSPPAGDSTSDTIPVDRASTSAVCEIAVAQLQPNPFQPRSSIAADELKSLGESIKTHGILQPITVRLVGEQYQIVAGERRWRAAGLAGLQHVPVIVREASDEQMLEWAIIENIQREDLNAIDRAAAYQAYCSEFGLKPEEVAVRLGEDRTTVVNYLRLLGLPEAVKRMVAAGEVSMGHARCLLGVQDQTRLVQLAESAKQSQLSVRALEQVVKRERMVQSAGGISTEIAKSIRPPHLSDLQRRFEEATKTKVAIYEGKRKGTGKITIDYFSLDDFDRIAGLLGVVLD